METSFLNRIVTDHEVRNICWTLVHSLWIGILAATLSGLVLTFTRKSTSTLRYRLLCGCLLLFVVGVAVVFNFEISARGDGKFSGGDVYQHTFLAPSSDATGGSDFQGLNVTDRLKDVIDQNSTWIFVTWLLFFVFKSIRLFGGVLYVHRVRSRGMAVPGEHWQQKLGEIGKRLGISKKIGLLQSRLVKIPVTIGHFRPVILIPAGMFLQLPYEQIEAILIHELAHIRRKDYLVNLLQALLETIFFFNPGLLWLSALIREERENCCDDIVLANTAGKSNYLEALLAFHQYDNEPNKLALSLRGNQLVNRLKRIINQENKRISIMEKIVLLAGMLGVSAFCFVAEPEVAEVANSSKSIGVVRSNSGLLPEAGLGAEKVPVDLRKTQANVEEPSGNPEKVLAVQPENVERETVVDTSYKITSIRFYSSNQDGENREMTVSDDQNNYYNLKVTDNKLTAAKVNGVEVAEKDLPNYQNLLDQVDRTWKEARERKSRQMADDRIGFEKRRRENMAARKEGWERKHLKRDDDWVKQKKDDWTAADKKWKTEKWPGDKRAQKEWHLKGDDMWAKTKSADWNKEKFKVKDRWADEANVSRTPGMKRIPAPRDISEDQERVRGIISELVDQKVIKNKSDLEWFGISEQELIVNGQKQPAELQQKLKEKYNISQGHGLYYGPVKMTGSGVFLDKEDVR